MAVFFNNDWDEVLKGEFEKPYYIALRDFLRAEYGTYTVYPPMDEIFSALKTVAYNDVKVVILGQDPYHNPLQAHGMCFSVKEGVQPPPSLVNIFKEIDSEYPENVQNGISVSYNKRSGYLQRWAVQGVLLLNAILTVRQNQPMSHKGHGWETFTDTVIKKLNDRENPVIFMLWGAPARRKAEMIDKKRHIVLQAAHPSPLSAFNGFFGCGHFKQANEILAARGDLEILW